MGRINKIKLMAVSIPLKKEFVTARAVQTKAESIFVEIVTEEGVVGIGEATPKGHVTGEKFEPAFIMMRDILSKIYLGKRSEDVRMLFDSANRDIAFNPAAKSAFDSACYDANARIEGRPLFRHLGGSPRDNVFLNGHMDLNVLNPEELLHTPEMERFHHSLKLKLGRKPSYDVDIIKRVKSIVGNSVKLIGDVNQGWTLQEALSFVSQVDNSVLEVLEQPLPSDDILGMMKLQGSTNISIMADEALWSAMDARSLLELGATRMVNIKLMKSGGITGALDILKVAEEKNADCMIGSTIETSLNTALEMSLSLLSERVKFVDSIFPREVLVDDPVECDVVLNGDSFRLSESPGNGCRLIDEIVEKYLVHEAVLIL